MTETYGLLEAEKYSMDESRLNISERVRTSRLPWRGQFSPELVEYFLDVVCPSATRVFDPFCGSGTVLFEAAARGMHGIGVEVNPAAWQLASIACLANSGERQLAELQRRFVDAAHTLLSEFEQSPPSQYNNLFLNTINAAQNHDLRACLSTMLLLAMGNKAEFTLVSAERAAFTLSTLIAEMMTYSGRAECYLADARQTPVQEASIDAVITSPPYINVFNYHQNYRQAVELLGWRPLVAARSEFGSNRKHRQNRFLTVIQYCLDMAQALDEISRVCRPGAPVVLVVGRESKVKGTRFQNSKILIDLINNSPALQFLQRRERVFKNRFGQLIYEDVLVARTINHEQISLEIPRSVGIQALLDALQHAPDESKAALLEAQAAAVKVEPSALFSGASAGGQPSVHG